MADSNAPETGDQSNQDGNNTGEHTSDAGDQFTPITSQDDLNRIIGKTREEERRKANAKFADYKDVKAKAAKFDELEEQKKSDEQKLQDRLTSAENDAATARLDALRFKYASKHQISDDDAELFLTGSDEETIAKQAERFAVSQSDRKKKTNYVPGEGSPASAPDSDGKREFLRSVTKRG